MKAIHWFRRDLRLSDNTALSAATKVYGGEIIPVFILSSWKSTHPWTGPCRQAFLCDCLRALAEDLAEIGSQLIIRQGAAVEELERLLEETGAGAIYLNRDPDPFGRATEAKLQAMGKRRGIEIYSCKDIAIHERDEILTRSGDNYRVFTPYSRAWRKAPKPAIQGKIQHLSAPKGIPSLPLPSPSTWDLPSPTNQFKAGERAAAERFTAFLSGPINRYAQCRDYPAANGTSRLSADLRFGTISIREIYRKCIQTSESATMEERRSIEAFINELIWREFYMQILWRWPEVLNREFHPQFRGKWMNLEEHKERFSRWCHGQTGFPLVDAAMRQLNATGFIINRLRMVTAMFLTKDLHLNWRVGERFFMQHLIDGDIAANNGGWQWSAGCGADACPYVRIQNPWAQSARFDPDGSYIYQWIPELESVPARQLHTPPRKGIPLTKSYPLPMLDHAKERLVALGV